MCIRLPKKIDKDKDRKEYLRLIGNHEGSYSPPYERFLVETGILDDFVDLLG